MKEERMTGIYASPEVKMIDFCGDNLICSSPEPYSMDVENPFGGNTEHELD